MGNQRVLATVRSSTKLEVPLVRNGRLLVSHEYFALVVDLAKDRFKENMKRIEKFTKEVEDHILETRTPASNNGVCSTLPIEQKSQQGCGKELEESSQRIGWEPMTMTVGLFPCKMRDHCLALVGQHKTSQNCSLPNLKSIIWISSSFAKL